MKRVLTIAIVLFTYLPGSAQDPAAPKGPKDWKIEVVAEQPKVNYCSVVCCAPDGRVFLAEDPMDMIGPPNQPIDRILCLHPDGKITVYAEKLYAIFGLLYMDGKLYVHHSPKFSVFDDAGEVGKNRVDLIDCTHPKPWGGMNDHIPSNFRLGMDGWFYMSAGDKGIYGAVGKDGSKAEIHGGGVMRFRPDGTKLEVYCTGTRNHLDVAINAEDEIFTYDNTDDGNGWWTRLTHMVDGGFYGYPYDYKPRRPYTLWMMADYGGGSPTGGLAYNEDALPKEYHGNLFMCEWGKGQIHRFIVERDGATFKVVRRDNFLTKGTKEFRPVGIAVSADGMSLYIADWNYGGWSNKNVKAGRLIKATYTGKSQAAPKPDWYVPAAMGKPFKAELPELIEGLKHPAQSVRLVAMRRIADRGVDAAPLLVRLLQDDKARAYARWSAIWTLDRIDEGRLAILAALGDADPSVRRQAARQLGTRPDKDATGPLIKLLEDSDRSVRFQAATALGRIGDLDCARMLITMLDETDLFCRYAAFTGIHRIGTKHHNKSMWDYFASYLARAAKSEVRDGILFAFREAYDPAAINALCLFAADDVVPANTRGATLALLGELSQKRPPWKAEWWGTQPVRGQPPARSVTWEGTEPAFAALRKGLTDSDAKIRLGAAAGIIASDSPQMAIELAHHVPSEKDGETRNTMLQALIKVRNVNDPLNNALNHLAATLLVKQPDDIRETLFFAAHLGSATPELTDVLLEIAGKKLTVDQELYLLEAFAKSKEVRVIAAMADRMQHADAKVRGAAARLLIGKGKQATQVLIRALEDKDASVRKQAAVGLGKLKDKAAIPGLLKAMNDKELRFDAISALAQMPDLKALDAYLEGLASKNTPQRDDCVKAVAAIKKPALAEIEARLKRQPPLAPLTILQLQKIYRDVPEAKGSALLASSLKEVRPEDFAAAALSENGNAERGKSLFFDLKASACSKCHRVGKEGGTVGPDLSGISLKYNRAQLIESVLFPSKQILDGYHVTIVETKAGQVVSGIIREDTADGLTLIDAEGKLHTIKKGDVESRKKSEKSIMPDGLQTGLSLTEFADLISYLESLKEKAPAAPAKATAQQGPLGPGDHRRTFKMGELERTYLVHVPPKYDAKKPTPVVLILHGAGTNGLLTVAFCGLNKTSDDAGFMAVYPDGTGVGPFLTWNSFNRPGGKGPDDVAFIGKVLDDLATVVNVDAKRVYATGISNGGMMCYKLADELSDRICAIAAIAGQMTMSKINPKRPVSVMHFHGTDDKIVPFEGPKKGFVFIKSVEFTIDAWVEANGCPKEPKTVKEPNKVDDGTSVMRKTYGPGKDGAEVVLFIIEHGGHTWPGRPAPSFIGKATQNISANDLMWEFFERHRLK